MRDNEIFGVVSHLDALLATAGPVYGLRILDIGCGEGQLTQALAREQIRLPPIVRTVMVTCSPYLLRPLRTLRQACSDISASHPELIPPGIDVRANVEKHAERDYTLAIKNKGRPSKPWRWEIYTAGKSKPVQQSEFFETMSEATRTGKAALAELQAKGVTLRTPTAN